MKKSIGLVMSVVTLALQIPAAGQALGQDQEAFEKEENRDRISKIEEKKNGRPRLQAERWEAGPPLALTSSSMLIMRPPALGRQ